MQRPFLATAQDAVQWSTCHVSEGKRSFCRSLVQGLSNFHKGSNLAQARGNSAALHAGFVESQDVHGDDIADMREQADEGDTVPVPAAQDCFLPPLTQHVDGVILSTHSIMEPEPNSCTRDDVNTSHFSNRTR